MSPLPARVRVLVADDHPLYRKAVAVLDIQMPLLDGLGVLNAVTRDELPTRVLLLTGAIEAARVDAAIGAGAAGCMLKDADADELCDAILAVGRGETVLAPGVHGVVAQEIRMRSVENRPLLTPREQEILGLIAEGFSAPGIAERLVLSPATVRTHLQHLYDKLGVSDRAAAVAEAMRRGLLE